MHCFFVVALAAVSSVQCMAHGDNKLILEENTKVCAQGTSITYDDVLQQFKDKFQGSADYPMKCFFKCLMQHEGWMNTDGEIELKPDFQEFSDCTQVGEDMCERAYLFHKCIFDKNGGQRMFGKVIPM